MPSRIIRESARTSPTLDALSAEAERLFWRLVTVADDHGRFEADPRIVLATAFPLRIGRFEPETVAVWLSELTQAGAVHLYTIGERTYGRFPTWTRHQRRPQSRSKFPAPEPPSGHDAATVQAPSGHGDGTVSEVLPRESLVVNREVVNDGALTMAAPSQHDDYRKGLQLLADNEDVSPVIREQARRRIKALDAEGRTGAVPAEGSAR